MVQLLVIANFTLDQRMKPLTFFISITVAVLLALFSSLLLRAEQVEHHGFYVESEGAYSECLSCHDNIIAKEISPCLSRKCFFNDSHPINRIYPPPNKWRDYAPTPLAEQAGIKLVAGQITCISCHNLHNGSQYHLRIDDRESRLCLACHLK